MRYSKKKTSKVLILVTSRFKSTLCSSRTYQNHSAAGQDTTSSSPCWVQAPQSVSLALLVAPHVDFHLLALQPERSFHIINILLPTVLIRSGASPVHSLQWKHVVCCYHHKLLPSSPWKVKSNPCQLLNSPQEPRIDKIKCIMISTLPLVSTSI